MKHCRDQGVQAAVIRTVDEIRPVRGEGHAVSVERTRQTTLVGYRDGVVVRTVLKDAPDDLHAQLVDAGFRVRAVSDNLS